MSSRTKTSPAPSPSSRARCSTSSRLARQNSSSRSSPNWVGFTDTLGWMPVRWIVARMRMTMAVAASASSRVFTDSPRKSSDTARPAALRARAASTASSSVSPATKRMAKLRDTGARVITFFAVALSLRRSRLSLSMRWLSEGSGGVFGGPAPDGLVQDLAHAGERERLQGGARLFRGGGRDQVVRLHVAHHRGAGLRPAHEHEVGAGEPPGSAQLVGLHRGGVGLAVAPGERGGAAVHRLIAAERVVGDALGGDG